MDNYIILKYVFHSSSEIVLLAYRSVKRNLFSNQLYTLEGVRLLASKGSNLIEIKNDMVHFKNIDSWHTIKVPSNSLEECKLNGIIDDNSAILLFEIED